MSDELVSSEPDGDYSRKSKYGRDRDLPDMTLARNEFFRRIEYLWNGKKINGHYLIEERFPSWEDLFGDLDQQDLAPLHENNGGQKPCVYSTYINRQLVPYALNTRGKKVIQHNTRFRDLKGDPMERLTHRVGVYISAVIMLYEHTEFVATYADYDGYTVDVMGLNSEAGKPAAIIEVITDHNNYELYRDTYKKLKYFHETYGTYPLVLFDKRDTAYTFLNHLYDKDMFVLTNGRFGSHPRIEWGRQQVFLDPLIGNYLADFYTISSAWRDDTYNFTHEQFLSLDW